MVSKFFFSTFLFLCAYQTSLYSSTDWAATTLAQLTLEEKIGQLFMVATVADQESGINANPKVPLPYKVDHAYIEYLIREYHVGGIIFLGFATPEQQIKLTNYYQQMSQIPLLIGEDCEWGLSYHLLGTIIYPRNGALSRVGDEQLIYDLGREIGRQMKQIGVHINFAPVVDVNNNPNNPVIKDRSFGADKDQVARLGLLMMRGLQDAGIIATAKHFPGHGDTDVDSHHDLPVLNQPRQRLHELELFPFKKLIQEGVKAVMTAHLEIPAFDTTPHLPASLSRGITTDLLHHELGFKGLVITDGLGMAGVTKHHKPGELELKALLAGNDILLCPMDVPKAVELIKQAIADGQLTETELDAHVLKILQAKEWSGAHVRTPIVYEQSALHTDYALNLQKKILEQINSAQTR